jgi:cell fate regulator YaaT (PSP1 superfamily)
MIEVIGIRFKEIGKIYNFSTNGEIFEKGDLVIVETSRGIECGEVIVANNKVEEKTIVGDLKSVIRKANAKDVQAIKDNKKKEQEAFELCNKKIIEHKLDMKLSEVEYTFDGKKILFYFTSDGRVDFRELVKDLASVFKARIELRQIGVRDESKMLGGLGICGRPFCCSSFLNDFMPVSIKMAKEQGLSLNPTKISGTCGRLMCCLKYEQESYDDLLKITPKNGAIVETVEGKGNVVDSNLISGKLKVRLQSNLDAPPKTFMRDDVTIIRDGQIRINKNEEKALKGLE